MCNHYRADPAYKARTGEFSHLRIPLRFPAATANYLPPVHVYPGRDGTVLRLAEDGQALEPAVMRWGLIAFFWTRSVREWKASCNNCKSEEMAIKPSFKGALSRLRQPAPRPRPALADILRAHRCLASLAVA